jgi:hypothetical protein
LVEQFDLTSAKHDRLHRIGSGDAASAGRL